MSLRSILDVIGTALPRRSRRLRLGHRVGFTLGVALATSLCCGAGEAAWWSRPSPDQADETLVSGARRVTPPPAPPVSNEPGWWGDAEARIGEAAIGVAAAVPQVVGQSLSVVGSGVEAVATTIGEFVWEVSYVFGANSTRVARTDVPDIHDHGVLPESARDGDGKKPVAPEPPRPLVAKDEPVAKPGEGALAPAVDPVDTRLLASLSVDKSQRRSDGSYFVPKPLQRLFDIRTLKADTTDSPLTVKLPGRIIPDPNAHGDVEASLIGRIEPPKTGMPVLGESVSQGQILAYVAPAVGVVDRTQVRREVARLTNDIRVTTENLQILKQFWFVPFRDGKIIQSELRLDGLRRERAALLPLLQTQEALRAAVDGVISVANATSGRIVHAGEKIFEIVDPKRLWVEAIAADPDIARGVASVDSARAVTPEGENLDLSFVGSGLALQQQSVPLIFRIDNPPEGLRVGRPVSVVVSNHTKLRLGVPLPREAVVTDSSGAEQVWELVEPEVLRPLTVKTEMLDGRSLLVVAGIEQGARIVVKGARLLAQLQ